MGSALRSIWKLLKNTRYHSPQFINSQMRWQVVKRTNTKTDGAVDYRMVKTCSTIAEFSIPIVYSMCITLTPAINLVRTCHALAESEKIPAKEVIKNQSSRHLAA